MTLDEQAVARANGWPGSRNGAAGTGVDDVVATFQRWLFLPDPTPLLAVLGAVAANQLDGDPVWLLLVGTPGSGKSELLTPVAGLPNVYPTATLTEAALLSGSPRKDHDKNAKGGLLREIGDFGIVLCKDFGSVLNMNRDARASVLAALREVYDGSWTRHVGTDGGRTLDWKGKVGLIAGCTPTIDRHHAVMGAMGERFVLLRLREVEANEQARRALAHAGREGKMREELCGVVSRLFGGGLQEPRSRSADETDRLVALVTLVVRCRSAVERDGYSREIELIPGAEAPTRLIVVLDRLLAGLDAVGVPRDVAFAVVTRAALDCIPATRRAVLDALFRAEGETNTAAVGEMVGYPATTTRRILEELQAHRIVRRGGPDNHHTWMLNEAERAQYAAILSVPEMSEGLSTASLTSFTAYSTTFRESSPTDLPNPHEQGMSGENGAVDEREIERLEQLFQESTT